MLVTGSGGFVGSAFAAVAGAHARLSMAGPAWREAIAAADFRGVTVVHLAARVHEPRGRPEDFDFDNAEKTRVLAEAAAAGGAARFVLASTVKVHGEETRGAAFRADSPPAPEDAYARSKWRAEEALRAISARTGLPSVVVRFPLTYGPGVGGNFRALLRLADSGAWLPFGAIENRRSLVHARDLAEALLLAAAHPRAPGQAFIAAHPEAVSTPGLLSAIRERLGRPRRLFPLPPALLEGGALVVGLGSAMRRLTRSLEADPGALVSVLGWQPRLALAEGIADTVAGWGGGRR
jgi:nucleoside-diphosphate-sugar epimerase